MTDPDPGPARAGDIEPEGRQEPGPAALVQVSFAATGALLVAAVAGVVGADGAGTFTAVVSVVLFAVGTVQLLWAYAIGVARSRDEQITLGGLFFLSGTAPPLIRFRLRLALAAQVLIAVAAAALRPYTSVAFVVLAPMLGLGAMGLWGARHGTFFAKGDDPRGGS